MLLLDHFDSFTNKITSLIIGLIKMIHKNQLDNIDEKISQLDLAIQNLLESILETFDNDKYYGVECAFILDHALNIKMHFFKTHPEYAPPHLQGRETEYDKIIHIREKNPQDRLEQIDPNFLLE